MRMHFACYVLVLLTVTAISSAQPDMLWSRAFGGDVEEWCNSVQQTADGGYILAGYTNSFGAGRFDFWLVKTDTSGTEEWNRTLGGDSTEYCRSVQQTSDGGYILVGSTESYGAGSSDAWLVKTDTNGIEEWSRTFGGINAERCFSVQQTSDSGYVLGATTSSYGAGLPDFWLVKTDANGIEEWSCTFGGGDADNCMAVQQTTDGGYVLAGGTTSFGEGWDFWLVRANAAGDSLWSRTFGGSEDEECNSVQQTSDGGYILGGYTDTYGAGEKDIWLVKTNENGIQEWSRTFGGGQSEDCWSLQQTSDGGYILGGYTETYGMGLFDFWLVKTDVDGAREWSGNFGGVSSDICNSVQQTTDDGYILGGYTMSYGAGVGDFWLVKTGPEGTPVWDRRIPTPHKFTLSVYPNPFNPLTTIAFDLPAETRARLCVFNATGRRITTLADGQFPAGIHAVRFDGSAYPSGIYFARIVSGVQTRTVKLMLIK